MTLQRQRCLRAFSVGIALLLAGVTTRASAGQAGGDEDSSLEHKLAQISPLAHVEKRGSGPIPVVLIPDAGYDWTVYETFMDRNAARYTMYGVTLPGMVGTPPPPIIEEATYKDLHLLRNAAGAVAQFIERSELNSPLIIGHGVGGHIAIWVALRNPGSARAAVSIGGVPFMQLGDPDIHMTAIERETYIQKRYVRLLQNFTDELWERQWRQGILTFVTDMDRANELADIFLSTPKGVPVEMTLEMFFSDLRPDLKNAQVPILFIAPSPPDAPRGITARGWLSLFNEGAVNTSLVAFADCRHFVMDDDPWQLDEVVRTFILGEELEDAKVSPSTFPPENPELAGGKELP